MSVLAVGCGSSDQSGGAEPRGRMEILSARPMLVGAQAQEKDRAPGAAASASARFASGLHAAYRQVVAASSSSSTAETDREIVGLAPGGTSAPLTNEMAAAPLIRKVVLNSEWALEDGAAPGAGWAKNPTPQRVTGQDIQHFVTRVLPAMGVGDNVRPGDAVREGQRATTVLRRFQRYVVAYSAGKFVDRAGRKIAGPAVNAQGVGNETITGLLSVALESLYDDLYQVPVWVTPKKQGGGGNAATGAASKGPDPIEDPTAFDWLTPTGEVPTAAVLNECPVTVADKSWAGRVRAIQFFSTVAGEQSKLVSGLVFRIFGDVQVSFVVGGSFAVGDNDTLAKCLDTFFDISSRRTSEATAYQYFLTHPADDQWVADLIATLSDVYDTYKKFDEARQSKKEGAAK